ncbi:hypothetical protein HRR80_000085 [Exophiala dermatitidis]|nr:hypothetical protein HRR76_008580 [Exophiala dermatitidis]KAJ4635566.1 hypothetical protein HRR86_000036 [Exophiala dermatitidis]KAJ4696269.1 hypothetical protein HRR87_002870 [Exophiala dermatitidis]KAJ8995309.1 hypothetical protein HRR80_000085 [Exophiala dermatitidis]KAJ9005248.1 hypothetical protein HRR94_000912 [Exophiala dermatitidis]
MISGTSLEGESHSTLYHCILLRQFAKLERLEEASQCQQALWPHLCLPPPITYMIFSLPSDFDGFTRLDSAFEFEKRKPTPTTTTTLPVRQQWRHSLQYSKELKVKQKKTKNPKPATRDWGEGVFQEKPTMADASGPNRPNSTIYVGGLDTTLVTAATLSEAFIPFGEIVDITLPKPEAPSSTDLHRGFGYVEFEDPADAKEAIANMDQSELYGRVIKVALAKPDRKDMGENVGLGSTTAIWEQEDYLAKYAGAATEDKAAVEQARNEKPEDPMEGLEGLDVAGPKPE